MNAVHVWSCGKCGALVRATVGTIVQALAGHAEQCPALRRPRRAAPPWRGAAAGPAPDHHPS